MIFYIQAMAFSFTHSSLVTGEVGKKGYIMESIMRPCLVCHDPVHMHESLVLVKEESFVPFGLVAVCVKHISVFFPVF